MNNKELNVNKTETIINHFVRQIYELDKSKKTLEEKIESIDFLINNLIDFCIKKKIFYYVENKISYSNIITNFKLHLIKFIKKMVDPTDSVISKYITSNTNNNSNTNWDNVSDINSLMFKNFKQLNESFEKNVSFNEQLQITNYDEGFDGFEFNVKSSINSNLMKIAENNNGEENNNTEEIDNLSLYIKILIGQNKYLIEFVDKLTLMCKILSDPDIKYKKSNPFE